MMTILRGRKFFKAKFHFLFPYNIWSTELHWKSLSAKSFHNYYDQIKVIVPWDMMESNLRSEFSTAKIQLTMKFSRVYNLMLHISLHIAKKIHYTLWIGIQQIVLLNENWYLCATYLHKFTSWNCPLCASSIPNILALRGYSNAHTHTRELSHFFMTTMVSKSADSFE